MHLSEMHKAGRADAINVSRVSINSLGYYLHNTSYSFVLEIVRNRPS